MNHSPAQSKGFTLIEIMVATSIFMIIMLMAMGALFTTSTAAKKSQALRTAMDNVNFAVESMTRSLRMGTEYTCMGDVFTLPVPAQAAPDCVSSPSGAIVFTPADTNPTTPPVSRSAAYAIASRSDGTRVLQRWDAGSANGLDLVASNVDVEKLQFFVKGADISDGIQPSVYILMKGSVVVNGEKSPFVIQTITSQRNGE